MTIIETILLAWAVVASVIAHERGKRNHGLQFAIFCLLDDPNVYQRAKSEHDRMVKQAQS